MSENGEMCKSGAVSLLALLGRNDVTAHRVRSTHVGDCTLNVSIALFVIQVMSHHVVESIEES